MLTILNKITCIIELKLQMWLNMMDHFSMYSIFVVLIYIRNIMFYDQKIVGKFAHQTLFLCVSTLLYKMY